MTPARPEFYRGTARRHGPGVRAALAALRCYQAFLSPLMMGSCRFYPSCSQYAYEAIEVHGVATGAWLALKRLLRCHPFARGGVDAVPAKEGTRS
ncbi:MAG TPA: membrane protein insertion efficiency factor YidD [Candidatus Acidoferrales bacterium]|nr:membrane protein insertion efficiency factor YidD [Candidatus Acidoferrales bacterium]